MRRGFLQAWISCGELAELAPEVVAVARGAAALADGLGHVRIQLRNQPRIGGHGDLNRFDGQLADDMDLIDEAAKPEAAVRVQPAGSSAASREAVHLTARD